MNLMILKHLLNREGLGGRLHHFEISLSVHVVSFTCFFHLFLSLVSFTCFLYLFLESPEAFGLIISVA
jgi:hypothetical protein